jgi:acyl-CoA thioesterase II
MALERLETTYISSEDSARPEKIERFRSLAAPFPPGEGTRSFGGHVYAQSAYAASKTVERGLVIHVSSYNSRSKPNPRKAEEKSQCYPRNINTSTSKTNPTNQDMTGTFILPGKLDTPYTYAVRHIRDGYMYSTRSIDARQNGKICFTAICSFKRDEKQSLFNHQPSSAQTRFNSILTSKPAEDQPLSPSVDADWWIENVRRGNITERPFPGLDVRKTDMGSFNGSALVKEEPERYRQLTQYRLKGSPEVDGDVGWKVVREREEAGEYDNLYVCAHMYSSDKNSLLLIPRALGIRAWSEMASLTLTVIVHLHGEALRMVDWGKIGAGTGTGNGNGNEELPMKWFVQEGWTPRAAENRAVHESFLWGPDGSLIATSLQDSMLRLRRLATESNL